MQVVSEIENFCLTCEFSFRYPDWTLALHSCHVESKCKLVKGLPAPKYVETLKRSGRVDGKKERLL